MGLPWRSAPGGADAHAGRLQAGLQPLAAQVALAHLAVGAEARHPEGAGDRAAVAADTEVGVDPDDLRAGLAADGPGGACQQAGSVLAVHAGKRHVAQVGIGEGARLDREHLAPGGGFVAHLEVVLVHAGDGAGEAAGAALDVQVEGVAHRSTLLVAGPAVASSSSGSSGSTLRTLHRSALKPGNPEMGSR